MQMRSYHNVTIRSVLQLKITATATATNKAVKETILDAEASPFWVEPLDPPGAVGEPEGAEPLPVALAVARGKAEVLTGAVEEGATDAVPSSTVKYVP